MGLFGSLFGQKKEPLTEEEQLRLEAEKKAYQEAVRKLKDRALLIRSRIREMADDKIFDELGQEQFVRYAKIVKEEEEIRGIAPAHYEDAQFSFAGPVHVLFLDSRLVIVVDAWESSPTCFSFSYSEVKRWQKKGGVFSSTIRFECLEGTTDGDAPYAPQDGWVTLTFYRKSEYTACAHCFASQLPALL